MIDVPFFKFPTTPHIIFASSNMARADKLLEAKKKDILLSNVVTIEEKIDGANLGISFGQSGDLLLQNRGQYLLPPFSGQWRMLSDWVLFAPVCQSLSLICFGCFLIGVHPTGRALFYPIAWA